MQINLFMLKRILQAGLALILFGFLIFYPSKIAAKTIIEEKADCYYKIKVKIVFDFKYQLTQLEAEKILTDWYKAMTSVWNGVWGSTILSDQCLAYYDFELVKMRQNKTCADYPEFHCISVIDEQYNARGYLADATITAANSQQNSWGEWTKEMRPIIAAHEVGHMMGLEDEYDYQIASQQKGFINQNYKNIGPQSIMAQTWDNIAAFTEHSLAILAKAGIKLE